MKLKKSSMITKGIACIAMITLCVTSAPGVISAENSATVEEFVEDFAEMVSEKEVTIAITKPVMDDDSVYGCYYELENDNQYAGYVIYSYDEDDIIEYSFEEQDGSMFEGREDEEVLYRNDPLDYEIDTFSSGSSSYDDVWDVIEDTPSVANNSGYTYYRAKYLKKRSMYSEDDMDDWGLDKDMWYGCAPMAMLNVCRECSFFDLNSTADIVAAYTNLYALAGTDSNGNTSESVLGWTIASFARIMKNISVDYTYEVNPTTSYFISAVNSNYPSIIGMIGGDGGHAVSVNGYIQYKRNSTGGVRTYLCVADGWYSRTRYICFTMANLEHTSGTVIQYETR